MARILIYDIETSPMIGYTWSLWSKTYSMDNILQDGRILCWCAKWLDEEWCANEAGVMQGAEWLGGRMKMLMDLRDLLDEADIIVAHNGDKFDSRWINREFLREGIAPPSPAMSVDTFKVAKKYFHFPSNKLDAICKELGFGGKMDTGGIELWDLVLDQDPKAQAKMLVYCSRDVTLLEKVYLVFRPWIRNHPNVSNIDDKGELACPNCGSTHVQKRGFSKTNTQTYQRFRCNSCGGWSRSRFTERPRNVNLLTQDKG